MADQDGTRDPTTGRFLPTKSGNLLGRPRKHRTADDAILGAAHQPITVTENGRRRRRSKLEVNAAQITNQGATGNLSAAKTTLDLVRRAEERQQASGTSQELSESDREIAERFVAQLRHIFEKERDHDPDADSD
ncbi:MAG TPA: DUF5681 domain-containing protein [Stellaceae bacterium]|nr:DUF5681 domain-containing protein [Stellaceae bacterium]